MIYKIFPVLLLSLYFAINASNTSTLKKNTAKNTSEKKISESEWFYSSLSSNGFQLPPVASFSEAFEGYAVLKSQNIIQNQVLTLIDFSFSSNVKRLWIIDMEKGEILYHSLVAHGKNSGEEFASSFSNTAESYKSSLGFYVTGEVYQGKHGLSLKLDGVEKGINNNARNRAIVIHGADYVSEKFIRENKRLGRSQGCPALPKEITREVIETIKNKSCLFIYHPSKKRLSYQSKLSV